MVYSHNGSLFIFLSRSLLTLEASTGRLTRSRVEVRRNHGPRRKTHLCGRACRGTALTGNWRLAPCRPAVSCRLQQGRAQQILGKCLGIRPRSAEIAGSRSRLLIREMNPKYQARSLVSAPRLLWIEIYLDLPTKQGVVMQFFAAVRPLSTGRRENLTRAAPSTDLTGLDHPQARPNHRIASLAKSVYSRASKKSVRFQRNDGLRPRRSRALLPPTLHTRSRSTPPGRAWSQRRTAYRRRGTRCGRSSS